MIHYGIVKLNMHEVTEGQPWKLETECGIIIAGASVPKTGSITTNLAEVTCPLCQEINAFRALQEFT